MSNFFSVHNLIHRDTAFTPGIALSHALHLRSHLAGERILSPTSLKARAQPITRLFEKMGRPDWLNEDHFYLLHSQSPEERAHFFTNNVARVLRPLFDKALVDSVAGAFHPNAETFLKQQKRIAIPFDLLAQSIQAGLITLAGAVTFLTGTLQHIDHLAHLQREQARPKFEPVQSLCVVGMAAGINFIAEGAAWLYLLSPLAALLGCDFLPRLVFSHFLSQHLKLDEPVRSIQTKAHTTLTQLRELHGEGTLSGYFPQQALIPTLQITAKGDIPLLSISPEVHQGYVPFHHGPLVYGGLYLKQAQAPES